MTESPTPEQLAELVDTIAGQSAAVIDLRTEISSQSGALQEAKQLTRRAIVVAGISLTVGVIGIVVAVFAVGQSWRTNRALEHAETQRQERSVASCEQSNDFYEKHNALAGHSQQTWIQARDQSPNALVKDFAQKQIDAFEQDKIALRDCTPDGITKYLSTTTTVAR